ncbi:venom serine protease-like isoform X1 [Drosophila eugracilis]|uniref:venom serine protease-like isoform X1 n=1 Tax=Drosophila eugracilis TaxID=29029 RepID=UPI001BDA8A9D|nr:venom serine protease-like isoform X1 [Drosophila eugracilis]
MWAPTLLITLATLTLTVQAASVGQECGKFNEEQYKKTNLITEPNEHPWVGRIVDEDKKLLCGGILIDSRHVLTAGHCVEHRGFSEHNVFGVVFGESDSSSILRVGSVTIHPDYSKHQHDLAIIELTKDVEFTDLVQPICLPSEEVPKTESDLIIAGFEGPSIRGPTAERLDKRIKMAFNRTDINECQKLEKKFPGDLICGHTEIGPLSGSALVDASGNPRKYHLIGITTSGFNKGDNLYLGNVNIRLYLDWIQKNTSK